MQWYNEPPAWSAQGNAVTPSVAPKQISGARRTMVASHNGHFYYRPERRSAQQFSASIYSYDQPG